MPSAAGGVDRPTTPARITTVMRYASEARERAADDDVEVALAEDVDAHGVRGLGVLADGARAQTPARAEERELRDEDQHDHAHRDRALVEEHREERAEERERGE